MNLDKFGKLLRNIRITRSLLLKDMADKLDISSAELSAIETGKKPIPDWFISAIASNYNIGESCENLLRMFARIRTENAE